MLTPLLAYVSLFPLLGCLASSDSMYLVLLYDITLHLVDVLGGLFFSDGRQKGVNLGEGLGGESCCPDAIYERRKEKEWFFVKTIKAF